MYFFLPSKLAEFSNTVLLARVKNKDLLTHFSGSGFKPASQGKNLNCPQL